MKKKVSALILAMGMMTAASLSGREVQEKQLAANENSQENNKRFANKVRRMCRIKAEKELLRESEEEIAAALMGQLPSLELATKGELLQGDELVHHEAIPVLGIDISREFSLLNDLS